MWRPWVAIGFPAWLVVMAGIGGVAGIVVGGIHNWVDRWRKRR